MRLLYREFGRSLLVGLTSDGLQSVDVSKSKGIGISPFLPCCFLISQSFYRYR